MKITEHVVLTATIGAICIGASHQKANAQDQSEEYTWDKAEDGFTGFQNSWVRVEGGWGGDFTFPIHSARMVGATGLSAKNAQASFANFLAGLRVPLNSLTIYYSNLEIWLQTYQSTSDSPFSYRLDNLTITGRGGNALGSDSQVLFSGLARFQPDGALDTDFKPAENDGANFRRFSCSRMERF